MKDQPKTSTCKRCGFVTDNPAAMREHILRQMRGYDPCRPPSQKDRRA